MPNMSQKLSKSSGAYLVWSLKWRNRMKQDCLAPSKCPCEDRSIWLFGWYQFNHVQRYIHRTALWTTTSHLLRPMLTATCFRNFREHRSEWRWKKKTRDATCFLGVSSPLPTRWKPHACQLGCRQLFRNHQLDLIFLDPQNHPKFAISIKIIKELCFRGVPTLEKLTSPFSEQRYKADTVPRSPWIRGDVRETFSSKPASSSADLPQTPAAKFPLVTIQRQGPLPRTHDSSEGTHWTPPSRSC